jgi:hypothetical protein
VGGACPGQGVPTPDEDGAGLRNDAGDPPDEVLQVGHGPGRAALLLHRLADPLQRLRPVIQVAVAAAAAVAVAATLGDRPGTTPGRGTTATGADQFGAGSAALVVAKALQPGPLVDFVRPTAQPGECALVPPGTSPTRAVASALRRALPAYRVRDVARTLDQSTGMCSLDLRAADARGSVVIVEVVAPIRRGSYPFATMNVGFTSDGTTSASVASSRSIEGWSITVAAVGPMADQPSSAAMLELAQDASLVW